MYNVIIRAAIVEPVRARAGRAARARARRGRAPLGLISDESCYRYGPFTK